MRAFVVLGLVFSYQAKRLAWGTSPKWPILRHKTTTKSIKAGLVFVVWSAVKRRCMSLHDMVTPASHASWWVLAASSTLKTRCRESFLCSILHTRYIFTEALPVQNVCWSRPFVDPIANLKGHYFQPSLSVCVWPALLPFNVNRFWRNLVTRTLLWSCVL